MLPWEAQKQMILDQLEYVFSECEKPGVNGATIDICVSVDALPGFKYEIEKTLCTISDRGEQTDVTLN